MKTPITKLKIRLTLLLIVLALLALIAVLFFGNWQRVFSPGRVLGGHASLTCADCHEALTASPKAWLHHAFSGKSSGVDNQACLRCHQQPHPHHAHNFSIKTLANLQHSNTNHTERSLFIDAAHALFPNRASKTVACSRCHLEHQGSTQT